jgi:preprotein translocase subunit SecD
VRSLGAIFALALALSATASEKEESGVFRLHQVFAEYDAKAKPTKVFGKHEMYNLGIEPRFDDEDVESARAETANGTARLIIKLKEASAKRLRQFTTDAHDQRMGIVLLNKLIDVPKITKPIENGELVVTMPSARDAEEVAKRLDAVARAEAKEKD